MPGFSLGTPAPTTDFVGTLVTDGERPFGTRASNRQVTLGVRITAPDWSVLAGARELLLSLIDQQFWTMTWTRRASPEDTQALPVIFSCFRAQQSTVQYGGFDQFDLTPVQLVTITFQALPYVKADVAQQIAFATPVAAINAPPPPPAAVVLDSFTTINNPQCTQSTVHVNGPFSCYWDPFLPPANTPDGTGQVFTYANGLPQPNLAGLSAVSMWIGLGSRYRFNLDRDGYTAVTVTITLTDASGNTLPITARRRLPSSPDPANPVFTQFTMPLPQTSGAFNYSAVVSYILTIRNRAVRPGYPGGELKYTCCYIDTLQAVPPSATPVIPSSRGAVYQLNGILGTVHSLPAMSFQQGPAPGTPTTLSTPGAGLYTVPSGTAYLAVSATGGGGAGATMTGAGVGGGGGGGESAGEPLFPGTAGQQIPYSIGAGGTPGATPANGGQTVFGSGSGGGTTVVANGGLSAAENSDVGGLGGQGSTNTQHFPGGLGRTASGSVGGGGGSGAGPAAPGLTPTGTAAVTLTGSGNWLCPAGVTQVTAFAVGGGGGGASGSSSLNGAGGGGGESATQEFAVVPGTLYSYAVGGGGAGGSSSGGVAGSNGSPTTFTVAGVVLTAHGGMGGQPTFSGGFGGFRSGGGGGAGGTGSDAPEAFTGGQGGSSSPYTGGGGSSAGTSGPGNPGTGYGGAGPGPAGGGSGGAGSGASTGTGHGGSVPGGGGGGSYDSGYAGGAGAAGTLLLSYPGGAPTNNGAVAPAGGGAGGAGGGSANTAGSAGSAPGGGGGGGYSGGSSEAGGNGGNGQIVVTPYLPPAFRTLIAHRPCETCPDTLMPLVAIGGAVPGSTEFPFTSLYASKPARLHGTYNIVAIAGTWNSPSSSRTISVTVRQYEYSGGPHYDTTTAVVTLTPSTQVQNGIVICGPLTLPWKAVPADNTQAYFTLLVNDSNGSDTWLDVLLLCTQGQTAAINESPSSTGYQTYYLDIPDPVYDLGLVLGSQGGRAEAVSVSDVALLSGGPLVLDPGFNILLAYAVEGAPSVSVSYSPAFYLDRLY